MTSDELIRLLESIDESLADLESPALDRVEAHAHTVGGDCICGVCGDEYGYGETYITTYWEFEHTPEEQGQDRVCWSCIGRYLDVGDWDIVAEESVARPSVEGLLRLARNRLRDANGEYAIQNDLLDSGGPLEDYFGALALSEEVESLREET